MKGKLMTGLLAVILLILSVWSLFVGVIDINVASLMNGSLEQWEFFWFSRLPRLLAILCTGVGMSVAGLIMQQLCMNSLYRRPPGRRFLPHSSASCWRSCLCRIPHCGDGQFSHSLLRSPEPGCLSGLSRKSSLRMWSWCRWWELCSAM